MRKESNPSGPSGEDGTSLPKRRRQAMGRSASPSPRPSPLAEGELFAALE